MKTLAVLSDVTGPTWAIVNATWEMLRQSAVFLLVGLLIAAFLHMWMSRSRWGDLLRGDGLRPVLLASAIGLPMPLCSCSVLPAAIALRKQGASKGATLSFLISTPETSAQSVMLTYSLIGPVMAIIRPLASCITALVAGILEVLFSRKLAETTPQDAAPACHCCCSDSSPSTETSQPASVTFADGLRHAFVKVFDDIVFWMFVGFVVAAIIQVWMPSVLIDAIMRGPVLAMLIMLVVGIPMYVCAEGSTPVAAALIAQGLSPGAALVFLLAGPATNIGAVGMLRKQLGTRTVAVYLASIACVSVGAGLCVDWLFNVQGFTLTAHNMHESFVPDSIKTAGAIALLAWTCTSIWRCQFAGKIQGPEAESNCCQDSSDGSGVSGSSSPSSSSSSSS
ncbi:MAG: hypothetical protein DHS20C16_00640 [Phycisphaerae bacterium]|nr:MAG: hypothetical protein DHS20C16_00640 [Phycisphaerae bacterium]